MSRRITWLVAATTSAVVLAFLIPLGLLVRNLAEDRALSSADTEARNIALLVSSVGGDPGLESLIAAVDGQSAAATTVIFADGSVYGTGSIDADDPDVLRAQEGTAYTTETDGGQRVVIPVLTEGGSDVVITEVSGSQLHSGVATAWLALGGLGVLMIAIALLIAVRIGRRIATPVTRVAAVADRMRAGELDARAPVEGPEEARALAEALNRLGDRIDELLLAERAAVGDLSHRLRTPVTALRIDVESAEDSALGERIREHVGTLQRTIDAIVRDARRPLAHQLQSSCDAAAVAADRAGFWAVLAEDQQRLFTAEIDPGPLPVKLEASDLRDLIDILIDNVFAHTAEGVGLSVILRRAELEGRAACVLAVRDDGGAPVSAPAEGHSGLGLQIARRIANAAGGTLEAAIDPGGGGSAVQVRFPLAVT